MSNDLGQRVKVLESQMREVKTRVEKLEQKPAKVSEDIDEMANSLIRSSLRDAVNNVQHGAADKEPK